MKFLVVRVVCKKGTHWGMFPQFKNLVKRTNLVDIFAEKKGSESHVACTQYAGKTFTFPLFSFVLLSTSKSKVKHAVKQRLIRAVAAADWSQMDLHSYAFCLNVALSLRFISL